MNKRKFIRDNRKEIDKVIRSVAPNLPSINDNDREEWIGSLESLYIWARSCGVNI